MRGSLPTNVRPPKSYNRTVIVPPIEYTSDRALSYCTPHSSTPGPVLYWASLPDCLAPKSGVCPSMAHIRLSTPVTVGHLLLCQLHGCGCFVGLCHYNPSHACPDDMMHVLDVYYLQLYKSCAETQALASHPNASISRHRSDRFCIRTYPPKSTHTAIISYIQGTHH